MKNIVVYKTDVKIGRDAGQITAKLLREFPGSDISFDLEDCDNVLRIESFNRKINARKVERLLEVNGCTIERLPY
jgi:hypothetical protein